MTEIVSNVYDLIYPSPVSLREISSIAVAVELWRCELKQSCLAGNLEQFPDNSDISLKKVIPDIPSRIDYIVGEYVNTFQFSMDQWLRDHFTKVFHFHRNTILNDFNDFAYDCNGAIHYVRTAKRMMACDRLGNDEKFRIACMYCFDEDIRRIWPSVAKKIDLNEIDFNQYPQLYYWICVLKNTIHDIPIQDNDLLSTIMLDRCPSHNWSSLNHFWNRINSENRLGKAIHLSMIHKEAFARFILPKLKEEELDKFVAERGSDLIYALLTNSQDKFYVLPTWMYIRNKMNEGNFTSLVEKLLETETEFHITEYALDGRSPDLEDWLSTEDETYLSCEVWKNAPDKLKRSAIGNVLRNDWVFERQEIRPSEFREVKFLIMVLLDATLEERNVFWHKNWKLLIDATRGEDLHRIMKLCFKNENDIALFRQNTMAKYENISEYCVQVLDKGCFKELDDFLSFCCIEIPKRRELKQRLLQQSFLGEDSILKYLHFSRAESMNKFIDDAYDSADQAAEFKSQLVSSPVTEDRLFETIRLGFFSRLAEFVDTFVSSEQVLVQMKKQFVDILRDHLITGSLWKLDADSLRNFLIWCLGNDDEIIKFKQSISADEVLHCMVKNQRSLSHDERDEILELSVFVRYHPTLAEFLIWYFETPKDIEEFKKKFANIFDTFSPYKGPGMF